MVDTILKEMVDSGAIHEAQVPFDPNTENASPAVSAKTEMPYTLELLEPIDFGSEKITEVVFKNRLRAGMVMHLTVGQQPKYGHFLPVIAAMTGQPEALIMQLGYADYVNCLETVTLFFVPSSAGG